MDVTWTLSSLLFSWQPCGLIITSKWKGSQYLHFSSLSWAAALHFQLLLDTITWGSVTPLLQHCWPQPSFLSWTLLSLYPRLRQDLCLTHLRYPYNHLAQPLTHCWLWRNIFIYFNEIFYCRDMYLNNTALRCAEIYSFSTAYWSFLTNIYTFEKPI